MIKDFSYSILLVFSNIAVGIGLVILVPALLKANVDELFILPSFIAIALVILFSILSWATVASVHKLDTVSVVTHSFLVAGLVIITIMFVSSLIGTSADAACYMPIDFSRTRVDCTQSYFSNAIFLYLIISPFVSVVTIGFVIASLAGLARIKSSSSKKTHKKNQQ